MASCVQVLCTQLPKAHLGDKQCAHKCVWGALSKMFRAGNRNSYKEFLDINGNPFGSGTILYLLCEHYMLLFPFPKER